MMKLPTFCLLALIILFAFGCASLTSVKDCGIVVDPYTMEQKDGRWECKQYTWWDKFWRGY